MVDRNAHHLFQAKSSYHLGMEGLSYPHALWTTNMWEEDDEADKQASE